MQKTSSVAEIIQRASETQQSFERGLQYSSAASLGKALGMIWVYLKGYRVYSLIATAALVGVAESLQLFFMENLGSKHHSCLGSLQKINNNTRTSQVIKIDKKLLTYCPEAFTFVIDSSLFTTDELKSIGKSHRIYTTLESLWPSSLFQTCGPHPVWVAPITLLALAAIGQLVRGFQVWQKRAIVGSAAIPSLWLSAMYADSFITVKAERLKELKERGVPVATSKALESGKLPPDLYNLWEEYFVFPTLTSTQLKNLIATWLDSRGEHKTLNINVDTAALTREGVEDAIKGTFSNNRELKLNLYFTNEKPDFLSPSHQITFNKKKS